jgi:hypothetical protein
MKQEFSPLVRDTRYTFLPNTLNLCNCLKVADGVLVFSVLGNCFLHGNSKNVIFHATFGLCPWCAHQVSSSSLKVRSSFLLVKDFLMTVFSNRNYSSCAYMCVGRKGCRQGCFYFPTLLFPEGRGRKVARRVETNLARNIR